MTTPSVPGETHGLASPIIHQRQPTPVSCTATCIAMAVGAPVESLGFDLERPRDFDQYGTWLANRGVWMRMMDRGARLYSGRLYLCGVRSLNTVNTDHAVLLDTRPPRKEGAGFNDRSGWTTYDPCEGIEGKNAYTWTDENVILDFCELVE